MSGRLLREITRRRSSHRCLAVPFSSNTNQGNNVQETLRGPNPPLHPKVEDPKKSQQEEARQKKIAKLKEELRRGYFYELGQVNRTKSKVRHVAEYM